MGNALLVQPNHVTGDQTVPVTADAENLNAMVKGGTDHSPDTGIHAGGVAAGGENTDSFYCHMENLLRVCHFPFYFTVSCPACKENFWLIPFFCKFAEIVLDCDPGL
jgi:hypothetical protein